MGKQILLLVPTTERVPLDELFELSGNENIQAQEDEEGLVSATATWDDVILQLQIPDQEVQYNHILAFQQQVDALLDGRSDKKAVKIQRRAERMVQVIRCEVEPDWDDDRKAQHLVQGIMEVYDYALMFADGTVYNENGNIEVGHPESKMKYWAQPVEEVETTLATERKKRSIEALKAENVPTINHLPVVPDEEHVRLRTTEEVVLRLIALYLLSKKAEGESLQWFMEHVQQYRLEDVVTEQEWKFVHDEEPAEYMVIRCSQRLEGCWLFVWALNFVGTLKRPDTFCNPVHLSEIILGRSREQLLLDAKLRTPTEILDALDLHYRYHWAIVDAELYGKNPPKSLEPAVIYERHYALNWLTYHNDESWDEVTTDT